MSSLPCPQRAGEGLMAARGGLGRTGVLSDRKKHGYPSRNVTRPEIS